jgi:hypothetical protein
VRYTCAMPEVLEAPPAHIRHLPDAARPFTFTDHARASAAGKRSGELRRARAAQLFQADKPPIFDSVQAAINGQLELVASQINRTRDVLNDAKYRYCEECERGGIEPHHRAQLLKALDTLLDRQRKLLGIGDPAPVKRNERGSRGAMIELRPLLADEQPAAAQVQPAGSRPYLGEYEDPPGMVREPVLEPTATKID